MGIVPADKIKFMPTRSNDHVRADAWDADYVQHMIPYITHFPDGMTEYSLIDKNPDAAGLHTSHAFFIMDAAGKMTDAGFSHMSDGHIFNIGQDLPASTNSVERNYTERKEAQFNGASQKLLDAINLLPVQDYAVHPESKGHSVTEGPHVRSHLELKNTVLGFLETQILSQKQVMGLNMSEMTAAEPRLESLGNRPAVTLSSTPA